MRWSISSLATQWIRHKLSWINITGWSPASMSTSRTSCDKSVGLSLWTELLGLDRAKAIESSQCTSVDPHHNYGPWPKIRAHTLLYTLIRSYWFNVIIWCIWSYLYNESCLLKLRRHAESADGISLSSSTQWSSFRYQIEFSSWYTPWEWGLHMLSGQWNISRVNVNVTLICALFPARRATEERPWNWIGHHLCILASSFVLQWSTMSLLMGIVHSGECYPELSLLAAMPSMSPFRRNYKIALRQKLSNISSKGGNEWLQTCTYDERDTMVSFSAKCLPGRVTNGIKYVFSVDDNFVAFCSSITICLRYWYQMCSG